MPQFEDILLKVGMDFIGGFSMLALVFVGADPGWKCTNQYGNQTLNDSLTVYNVTETASVAVPLLYNSSNQGEDVVEIGKCTKSGLPCSGHTFNPDFTSIVTEWDLICNRDFISDTISSLQMAGVLIGSLVFGQLGDAFGRKKVYFFALLFTSIIGAAQAITNGWIQFAALRFINGTGIGGCIVAGYIWSVEFLGPKYRPVVGGLGLWPLGSLVQVLLGYFIREWRTFLLSTTLPGLSFVIAWWFLPESPRWLLSQGRYDEVVTIAERIAKGNKKPLPDMDAFVQQCEEEMHLAQRGRRYGFWDLFRTPTLTRTTTIIMFIWFTNSLLGYGLLFNLKNLPGNKYVHLAINASLSYFAAILILILTRWFGRSRIVNVSMLAAAFLLIPLIVLVAIGRYTELWMVVSVISNIAATSITISWQAVFILTSESYPTPIRNQGLGFASMSARIGGIIAPQMAYVTKFWQGTPYVISVCFALVAALVTCFLPETRQKALEDGVPPRSWCFCMAKRKKRSYNRAKNTDVPLHELMLQKDEGARFTDNI
ncbi:organic cation transporter protein-like [Lingula anatina]|uniref:Organic cation transporter protein-like n=1 Tax=Lingula anatina TaxID=7574 RepID=A0A2R2MRQ1_LINAN|nr:organic cation transporter protein-like [Lingula anatina]|eukprot:XP_023932818.1 organic cation transporter protein-like [Lingula anatina]